MRPCKAKGSEGKEQHLDVLAGRQSIEGLVKRSLHGIRLILGQQPCDLAHPDFGAAAEFATHGFQSLLCQLILHSNVINFSNQKITVVILAVNKGLTDVHTIQQRKEDSCTEFCTQPKWP